MNEVSGANFTAGRRGDEYDFFRCTKCLTLITKPQMDRALASADGRGPCPCGSLHYSPSNPPPALCEDASVIAWLWFMVRPWAHWAVWTFTVERVLRRA